MLFHQYQGIFGKAFLLILAVLASTISSTNAIFTNDEGEFFLLFPILTPIVGAILLAGGAVGAGVAINSCLSGVNQSD